MPLNYICSIKLSTVNDCKELYKIACNSPVEMYLVSGYTRIPASSLMCIFSLDLSKSVEVYIEDLHYKECITESIKYFVVKED